MKGLDLSEAYYLQYKSLLHRQFGDLLDRVAVGMVGPGSECFGFDDAYSRDHDWGPAFCLWMTDEDYRIYGQELHRAYVRLPQECCGFAGREASAGEQGRVGAMPTSFFYRRYTGLDGLPQNLQEWNIPMSQLALCTNGAVFSDSLGEFSRWREGLLSFYPEDMRRKLIADCCMRIGQAGQYNWQRGILRDDSYVMGQTKMQFCSEVMNLCFLLNRRYSPYFKWLFMGAKNLSILGRDLAPLLDGLMRSNREMQSGNGTWQSQQETMTQICDMIIAELYNQGLSDAGTAFLVDHVPSIISKIEDKEFQATMRFPG